MFSFVFFMDVFLWMHKNMPDSPRFPLQLALSSNLVAGSDRLQVGQREIQQKTTWKTTHNFKAKHSFIQQIMLFILFASFWKLQQISLFNPTSLNPIAISENQRGSRPKIGKTTKINKHLKYGSKT